MLSSFPVPTAGGTSAKFRGIRRRAESVHTASRIKNIADFSGIAVSNFVALRQAAQGFGVSLKTIDQAVSKIGQDIALDKVGLGDLLTVRNLNPGKISVPNLPDSAKNFERTLKEILQLVNSIESSQDKFRFCSEIL